MPYKVIHKMPYKHLIFFINCDIIIKNCLNINKRGENLKENFKSNMKILFKEASFKSWIDTLVGSKKNDPTSNDLEEVLKNSDLSRNARQELIDCQNKRVQKIEEIFGQKANIERSNLNKIKSSSLRGQSVKERNIKKGHTQNKQNEQDIEIGNR